MLTEENFIDIDNSRYAGWCVWLSENEKEARNMFSKILNNENYDALNNWSKQQTQVINELVKENKKIKAELESTKTAYNILNDWRNKNLDKINDWDSNNMELLGNPNQELNTNSKWKGNCKNA